MKNRRLIVTGDTAILAADALFFMEARVANIPHPALFYIILLLSVTQVGMSMVFTLGPMKGDIASQYRFNGFALGFYFMVVGMAYLKLPIDVTGVITGIGAFITFYIPSALLARIWKAKHSMHQLNKAMLSLKQLESVLNHESGKSLLSKRLSSSIKKIVECAKIAKQHGPNNHYNSELGILINGFTALDTDLKRFQNHALIENDVKVLLTEYHTILVKCQNIYKNFLEAHEQNQDALIDAEHVDGNNL